MSKYNAKSTLVGGYVFQSKKEASHWCMLKSQWEDMEIEDLKVQVKFELIPKGEGIARPTFYIADFTYIKDGKLVVEDVKGYKAGQAYALYKLKAKLMQHVHGIKVVEI